MGCLNLQSAQNEHSVKVNEALKNAKEISKAAARRFGNQYVVKTKSEPTRSVPKTNVQIGEMAGCGRSKGCNDPWNVRNSSTTSN